MAESTSFVLPENPGVAISFVGERVQRPAPSFSQVVAIPIVHDWGPLGTDLENMDPKLTLAQFEGEYGSGDTEGRTAVVGALNGVGLLGQGGAGGVIPFRMAGASKAKATRIIQNTTPATALTLTAKYHGTRGNDLGTIVDDDPQDATKDRLRITFRGAVVETYRYAPTDITALAAAINLSSKWVTAVADLSGVALTQSTLAFAGGDNGATLTLAEWQDAWDALEFANFGIYAPFNLVDTAILAAQHTWVQLMAQEMRPIRAVIGGPAGETLAQAITRTAPLRDPHVISLGVGTYHDDLLDKDLSTAQLAPRLAGVLAARGEDKALTYAEVAGLSVVGSSGPTTQELRPAADAGVTVFRRESDLDAELVVSRGVTTYIADTQSMPKAIFSEPRMIGIMDNFIRNMKRWAARNVIGDLTVTDDTRAAVRSEGTRLLNDLLTRQLILPGDGTATNPRPYFITLDTDDPALEDAIPFQFGWKFARTANFVVGQGRVL